MSEQSPGFDDEFREAIEQAFGMPLASENEIDVPPDNEDEAPDII